MSKIVLMGHKLFCCSPFYNNDNNLYFLTKYLLWYLVCNTLICVSATIYGAHFTYTLIPRNTPTYYIPNFLIWNREIFNSIFFVKSYTMKTLSNRKDRMSQWLECFNVLKFPDKPFFQEKFILWRVSWDDADETNFSFPI